MTAGLLIVPSGSASAEPGDDSEGLAKIIDADLLTGDLATVGTAASGNPSDAGPIKGAISASVLDDLIGVNLPGIALPLISDGTAPGLLDLGDLGALGSFSSSLSANEAVASAGIVTDSGAIDLGEAFDPGSTDNARLDLTALLDQLEVSGLTDNVVDRLSIELGALASRAEATGPGAADRTYGLAGAQLTVRSPAVARLTSDLQGALEETEDTLNGAVGAGGTLSNALAGVNLRLPLGLATVKAGPATASLDLDLSDVTQDLLSTPLVDANEFVSINLADGTITINLAKIVKNSATATDLNGLAPNTQLLSGEIIGRVSDSIADALGDVGETVGTVVTQAVNAARLTVSLPGSVDPLIGPTTSLDITVAGSLGDFAGTSGTQPRIDIDASGSLGDLLDPVLNALRPALTGVVTNVVRPVVTTLLDTVTGGIEPAINTVTAAALAALQPLLDEVLPNIATITINEQTENDTNELENETGSSTVRALAIDLLPNLDDSPLAEVNLASSTVRVTEAEVLTPVLVASPDPVRVGSTVSSALTGYAPNSDVTVTYTDADDEVIGTQTVRSDGDGGATATFTVPAGTSLGDLVVTGTDADDNTASDTVQVVVAATLDASPASVPQQGTVSTNGAGWLPNSDVVLTYVDSAGEPVGEPVTVRANADGEFTSPLTLPAGTPPGTLTITGVGEDGATATDTVRVEAAPVLLAAPEEVSAGDTVTVTSSGWPPNTPVTLTYTDDDGEKIGTSNVTTDAVGVLTGTFTVPAGTPFGDLVVTGTDSDGRTATDTVQVVAEPALTASPDPVVVGETVTSSLTGYSPLTEVTVTYTDADDNVIGTRTVTTDAAGAVTDTFVVPTGTPAGALTIVGTDADDNTARDTVTVAPAAPAEPTLTVGPAEVEPGDTVTSVGGGFPPNTEVDVTYSDANGVEIGTKTVDTDGDGNFTVTFDVPAGTPVGELTVVADDGDGASATDSTTVVAPVFDPTLTAAPDPVLAGDSVNVVGVGYPPNTEITVTYTDVEGTELASQTVTTDENGAFTGALLVPVGTPPGALTIVGSDDDGNTAQDSVDVEAPAFMPVLDAAPGQVAYGDDIAVVSSGWPANSAVTITYTDSAGAVVDKSVVTTDANGTFTDSVTVPPGTALGDLTVEATGGDDLTASDVVEVQASPELVAGPGAVLPGDTVTSNLTGYPPNTEITITYTDADDNDVTQTVTTDDQGSATDTFVVPAGTPAGELTITGDDGDGNSASDSVTVAPVAEPDDPMITVGPDPVEPGDTVTTVGGGFPPNTEVEVTYTDVDGKEIGTQTVTTDEGGAFTDAFVVPPGTPAGELAVVATDGDGATAEGSTTVVAPDVDPQLVSGPGVVSPGETVRSNLTGYVPNTEITVTYTDADGDVIGTRKVTTDENGNARDTFVVPAGTPQGALTISGEDAAGNAASDTVNVSNQDADDPTIIAGPPTVSPGDTVDVDGSGFPPNTDVTVVVTDNDGKVVEEFVVRTDGDGNFSDSFVVPAGTAVGPLTITASDGDGNESSVAIQVVASGADTGGVNDDANGLPATGSPVGWATLVLALMMLTAGAGALSLGRMRGRPGVTTADR